MADVITAEVESFLAELREGMEEEGNASQPRNVIEDVIAKLAPGLKKREQLVHSTAPSIRFLRPCRSVDVFKKKNTISEGSFGRVYRAEDTSTTPRAIRAIKQIKTEWLRDQGFPYYLLREINVLLSCEHENIVTVFEVCNGPVENQVFIVMEYVETDIKYMLKHEGIAFSPSEIKCIMLQLLTAVHYMHTNWIVHRDMKTSNLLLSKSGCLKVCDFGLARHYSTCMKNRDYTPEVCTMWYRSPEAIFHDTENYGPPMDIWSCGIIFAELVTKVAMFSQCTSEVEMVTKAMELLGTSEILFERFAKLPHAAKVFSPSAASNVHKESGLKILYRDLMSPLALDLLSHMLNWDPSERITAEDALNHPYFTHEEPRACTKEELSKNVKDFNSEPRRRKRTRPVDEEDTRSESPPQGGPAVPISVNICTGKITDPIALLNTIDGGGAAESELAAVKEYPSEEEVCKAEISDTIEIKECMKMETA